jgi:hypothetical protein
MATRFTLMMMMMMMMIILHYRITITMISSADFITHFYSFTPHTHYCITVTASCFSIKKLHFSLTKVTMQMAQLALWYHHHASENI